MALPSNIYKRGRKYWCRFWAGGLQVREPLSTDLEVAKKMLKKKMGEAYADDTARGTMDYPWSRLVEQYLEAVSQTERPKTLQGYRRDLHVFTEFAKPKAVKDITEAIAAKFRASRLAEGASERTVNKQIGSIRQVLNYGCGKRKNGMHGEKLIPRNPLAGLQKLPETHPRKERRAMTFEEVLAVFEHSPAYLRPIWQMFCRSGLRLDELCQMKFEHINFAASEVTVKASYAKGKRDRTIPLDAEMLAMLVELRDAAPNRTANYRTKQGRAVDHDFVFVNAANCRYRNEGNLLRAFYAICKKAGITDARPWGSVDIHAMRVTFASMSIDCGADPKSVQGILGHKTLDMTMRIYTKISETGKRRAVEVLPFNKKPRPLSADEIVAKMADTVEV
jgi:integrase/recombinase XerD